MAKALTAYTLKTQLGRVLRELRDHERFVILRRNLPVGVLVSIQDYVKEHADQYEDVEDFMDTLLEEGDAEFQRSLKEGAREAKRGRYLTHTELKLALANKKLR
ncbi:MAG TPA: type II toxin-antitoxin system prevent-host-death family antitoxin [Candidatus Acidoferrales bacterium]|nr:type II toxin-antitoxin system prevent-host-death family antitoxin [Candidatus Acidoferrales bacterium]